MNERTVNRTLELAGCGGRVVNKDRNFISWKKSAVKECLKIPKWSCPTWVVRYILAQVSAWNTAQHVRFLAKCGIKVKGRRDLLALYRITKEVLYEVFDIEEIKRGWTVGHIKLVIKYGGGVRVPLELNKSPSKVLLSYTRW